MDVKLKTFITLMEQKSTTLCADSLHITQPAVTQHIHGLEKEYDVELFTKKGRCLVPTEKGLELYRMARKLSTVEKQIHLAMHRQDTVPIYFGATHSIAETILPSLVTGMLKEFPQSMLKMHVQNTHTLLEALEKGRIHFALIEGNADHRRYICKTLMNTKFICICKKDGMYAKCKNLKDLLHAPLLLREEGSGSRDILEHTLHLFDTDIKDFAVYHELESISVILSLVMQDLGITFIYQDAASEYLKKGVLQQLIPQICSIDRQFAFVTLPDMPFTENNLRIYKFLRKMIQERE